MLGQVISHYRILGKLGAGGMGVVYEAEDTRLGRLVALKFLPEAFSTDEQAVARFRREARAASALNHPNICSVFDIGEHEGRQFLVMERIEGETLRDRLTRGPLPISTLLTVATELADALDTAHAKGIVHRDIKPANICLTARGHAKVLDFGLAKVSPADAEGVEPDDTPTMAGGNDLTGRGTAMGTVAYMSPEQARGEPVDHRTDIFSLGAVLYEMATGEQAFSGGSTAVVFDAILNRTPPPANAGHPGALAELDRLIFRAVEKDPDLRYQSAADLRSDLKRLTRDSDARASDPGLSAPVVARADQPSDATVAVGLLARHRGAVIAVSVAMIAALVGLGYGLFDRRGGVFSPPPVRSIAVLPFATMGGGPDAEYLGDGIAENLINALSRVPQLRVIPRAVAFSYKGQEVDPRVLGAELGVQAVITGRVTPRGDTLVVGAELTDVESVAQLWGQQYTREMPDVPELQTEITRDILRNLRMELGGDADGRLPPGGRRGPPPGLDGASGRAAGVGRQRDPEGVRLVMRGRFHLNRQGPEDLRRARELFEEAVDRSDENAAAYAGLSYTNSMLGMFGLLPGREAYPRAEAAALNALRLDDSLVEAHLALGIVRGLWGWDFDAARAEIERAIELDPNHAEARMMRAMVLNIGRQPDEALAEARRALALDPVSPQIGHAVGVMLYATGRYAEAVDQLQASIEIEPGFIKAYEGLTYALLALERSDEALAAAQAAPFPEAREMLSALVFATTGREDEARAITARLEALVDEGAPVRIPLAILYKRLGDIDQSLEWLQRAVDAREPAVIEFNAFGDFESLWDDPRLEAVLEQVGLARLVVP